MKDHRGRREPELLRCSKAIGPTIHGDWCIADRAIRKKRHRPLRFTRHETELHLVIALIIAVREPAAVGYEIAQGGRGGHVAAFWGKPRSAASLPLTMI
jgi:hypothetical protein